MFPTKNTVNIMKKIQISQLCYNVLNNYRYPYVYSHSRGKKYGTRASDHQLDINSVISEAEKIVLYPTSFLNLRWLLNDEIANIAMHLRKLMETNHPFIKTARNLITCNTTPSWGLIVLLVSKAGGLSVTFADAEQDVGAGILHSQRALAEVVEMVKTSHLIHKSLINIDKNTSKTMCNMTFGNKIALLSGDYLLSKSYNELACLRNPGLNELISSALRDLVEAEFVGPHDKQNMPLPAIPANSSEDFLVPNIFNTDSYEVTKFLGHAKSEWTLRNTLGGASLLGKCCQGTLMLAGHSMDVQKLGFVFAKNLALALQARLDIEHFYTNSSFSLVSAPVLFHLQEEPEIYKEIEKGLDDVEVVDYDALREIVRKGPGINRTLKLQEEHSNAALDILSKFKQSDARHALINIIKAM